MKVGRLATLSEIFLGIQTNFAYIQQFGECGHQASIESIKWQDIRPLKPKWTSKPAIAQLKFQEERSKKIKGSIDTIYKRSVQDFAHWTSATIDADPLWLFITNGC